jgi:hypothetical protein
MEYLKQNPHNSTCWGQGIEYTINLSVYFWNSRIKDIIHYQELLIVDVLYLTVKQYGLIFFYLEVSGIRLREKAAEHWILKGHIIFTHFEE